MKKPGCEFIRLFRAIFCGVAVALTMACVCAASPLTRANVGMAGLQDFYNTSTGLYDTPAGWWQSANALETTIDYTARSGTTLYLQNISTTFNNNRSVDFLNDYYDDEGWWALAWIKAYDLTGNTDYLAAAKTIFTDMTGAWDDTCNGGVWWSKARNYKNAITNELFLSVAARLHNRTPGDGGVGSYLDWAQREWRWFAASGMINANNLINDGLTSSCQNNGQNTWSYNQGVILGGLADLYEATNDASLLTRAEALAVASTTSPALVNSNGILVEACERDGCGNDGPQFKGIYAKNLYYLYTIDQNPAWREFLVRNANSIWANDRSSGNLFGLHWGGPFDRADGARQSIGLDVLNSVIPKTSYAPVTSQGSANFSVMAQTSGTYRLTFRFEATEATTRTVLVNSEPVSRAQSFEGTSAQLRVSLTAGQNRITVVRDSGNRNRGTLTLAGLDVAPIGSSFATFEAEDAESSVGVESSNGGFSGSGYRCCWSSPGQYVTFNVSVRNPGAVKLNFRYAAAAGNASRKVFVNGIPVQANLGFPNTDDWSNWSYTSMKANLREGSNSVTVFYDQAAGNSNFINLDSLQVLH